ncbi:MAG: GNAT family N-acetyltransferase [Roseburia sp.]|nr:GNAT family N-acetyltransferase [Roseburia sp.]
MSKVILHKPLFDELDFRQMLLSDEDTMAYNHAYGGTIEFPTERWDKWYKKWIEDVSGKKFYRYIQETEQSQFVGEVAYYYDEENDKYICDVIIHNQYRGKGFGKEALLLLCEAAKRNGIDSLCDNIAIDNSSINLFFKAGFIEEFRTDEYVMVKKNL